MRRPPLFRQRACRKISCRLLQLLLKPSGSMNSPITSGGPYVFLFYVMAASGDGTRQAAAPGLICCCAAPAPARILCRPYALSGLWCAFSPFVKGIYPQGLIAVIIPCRGYSVRRIDNCAESRPRSCSAGMGQFSTASLTPPKAGYSQGIRHASWALHTVRPENAGARKKYGAARIRKPLRCCL